MSIRFVRGNDASNNEYLIKASKGVEGAKLTIGWISEEEALCLTEKDNCMYICDPFKGRAFEHIQSLGCRIIGPQCVLSCLLLEVSIPKAKHPVFSMAMKGVVISCSNIEKKAREKIHTHVQWMGGEVLRSFTELVTHLVAGEVGSKKYHVAASLNKCIMLPEWVDAVWEAGKQCHVVATDPEFDIYRCPIFKGCIICVTGLESDERKYVKRLTEENGGRYSGELKFNECTHLIVNVPKGQKYDFARRWKIHCITLNWFRECLKNGACQDENLYTIEPSSNQERTSTSTPNKTPSSRLSTVPIDVSSISFVDVSKVDETMNTTVDTTCAGVKGEDPLNSLDLYKPPAEDFLDACKIYLSGFSGSRLEKVRKIINIGGGTRFSQFTASVSHVVVETATEDHIELVTSSDLRPEVVTVEWLVDCFTEGKKVSEQPYICLDVPTYAASPQKQAKNVQEDKKKSIAQKNPPEWNSKTTEDEQEDEDVMLQYLDKPTLNYNTGDKKDIGTSSDQEGNAKRVVNEMENEEEEDDDDATQIEQDLDVTVAEREVPQGIFIGSKFSIFGFFEEQEEEIEIMIGSEGGIVIARSDNTEADYQIVPITTSEAISTVCNVATNCWVQKCIESQEVYKVSSNPLFRPIPLDLNNKPLKECVISVSQYIGVERDCIQHIAELLGATCQEYFVRKAKTNLKANTHLLLKDPEGSKYEAAKKWKIPAVGKLWLLKCAKQGRHVEEDKYLIDNKGLDTTMQSPSVNHDDHEQPAVAHVPRQEPEKAETVEIEAAHVDNDREEVEKEDDVTVAEENDEVVIQNVNRSPIVTKESKPSKNASPVATVKPSEQLNTVMPNSKKSTSRLTSENVSNMSDGVQFSKPKPVSRRHSELQRGSINSAEDTPTKFLAPGYRPKFDLTDALAFLETPPSQRKMKHAKKSSVSLNDLMALQLKQAVKNAEIKRSDDDVFEETEDSQAFLKGVIICVSMKLSKKLTEYNKIATELGADFRWTYDEGCSHFLYQGRAKDSSKELKLAREQKKCIVSPHWLLACQEERAFLDPSLYPHTYNPKMSLTVSKTPSRRSSRKTTSSTTPAVNNKKTSIVPVAKQQPVESVTPAPRIEQFMSGHQESSAMKDSITEEELLMLEAMEQQVDEKRQPENENDEVIEEVPELEKEGSLEEREDFQKQMEQLMTSAMPNKGGKRRSRRTNSNSSGSTVNTTSVNEERLNNTGSARRPRSKMSSIAEDAETKAQKGNSAEVPIEASQNIQITWDDPAGREVRKEIMEQLQRSSSPTQQQQLSNENEDSKNESNSSTVRELIEAQQMLTNEMDNEQHMLEEAALKAPPIRLPPAQPAVAPAPLTDKQKKEMMQEKSPPIFMLSSMKAPEKLDYAALIEQLGGVVKETVYFDMSTTHLVVGMPSRNEKYLSALSTGKWILHKSYLEACREVKHFVEEDMHEWGSAMNLSGLPEKVAKLALPAPRWRKKIQEERNKNETGSSLGAFESWHVLLCVSKSKEEGFKRLLQAGGARILESRAPFNSCHYDEATHAFISQDSAAQVDIQVLLDYGILCLKPEYIAEFLMQDPVPSPFSYLFKEAIEIMKRNGDGHQSINDLRKRKTSSIATASPSKKTRLR